MIISFKTVFIDPEIKKENIEEYKQILESVDSVISNTIDINTDIIVSNDSSKYANYMNDYFLTVINEKEFASALLIEKLGDSKFDINKDQKLRDSILRPYFLKNGKLSYSGGVESFSDVPFTVMKKLFSLDFIDPSDLQNNSPTNKEFLEFGKSYPFVKYHGYAVSVSRDDYRISIEGVNFTASKKDLKNIKRKFIKSFKTINNGADEVVIEQNDDGSVSFYSWFD